MVTKYSVDVPADPRRVKAYSRTAPLFSNPTYCKTSVSLTRSTIPESEIVACVSLGAPPKKWRDSKERQTRHLHDGTLMRLAYENLQSTCASPGGNQHSIAACSTSPGNRTILGRGVAGSLSAPGRRTRDTFSPFVETRSMRIPRVRSNSSNSVRWSRMKRVEATPRYPQDRFAAFSVVLFVLLAKIVLVLCPAADCHLSRIGLLLLFGAVYVASLV
jgi:hypothetical protein